MKNPEESCRAAVDESTSCTKRETFWSPDPIALESWRGSAPASHQDFNSKSVATVGSCCDRADGSERSEGMKVQSKFCFVSFGNSVEKCKLVSNYLGSLCCMWAIVQCWSKASCSTFTHYIIKAQNTSLKALSCYWVLKARSLGCRVHLTGHRICFHEKTYPLQENL